MLHQPSSRALFANFVSGNQGRHLSLGLALAGVLSIVGAPAQADIAITGGNASFTDSRTFVPDTVEGRSVIFQGTEPTSFLIRTTQGDIPLNAIFRTSTLPQLSTAAGDTPGVGDTGSVLGTVTFRGFTSSGEPGLYSGIPTQLDFRVTSGTFSDVGDYTLYQTDPRILTETGTIVTPTTFTTSTRSTPVVIVEYKPDGQGPTETTVLNETFKPSDFSFVDDGVAYDSKNLNVSLTGGSVSVPNPPGFKADATVTQTPAQAGTDTGFSSPIIFTSSVFTNLPTTVQPGIGVNQLIPVMPQIAVNIIGIFVFDLVPSDLWFDPPTAEAFEFTMKPSAQRVGVASRVFPGFGGTRQETSTFKAITGLPKGIDKDETFTVSVKGVTLGEFKSDQTVRFSDYKAKLGDLWRDGGVESFTVSGIDGGVDPRNPRAFPIRLQFNTPTASFEMKAQGVKTAAGQGSPIARLMSSPNQ
jgi:hypothetical protein